MNTLIQILQIAFFALGAASLMWMLVGAVLRFALGGQFNIWSVWGTLIGTIGFIVMSFIYIAKHWRL